MPARASVEGHERPRLFLGLPLPGEALERLVRWQLQALPKRDDLRLVARGNLHVTLAFLGATPAGEMDGIVEDLRAAATGADPIVLEASGYRETRSVGMLVFEDEQERATQLAERLWSGLERLGVYERERRPWLPHVTVLRFRRPPRLDPSLPELGPVSPSEVALYHSRLRPSGAQYEVVESVALGG
jgi:RNA 2',3'-cyclic 3'-phosphodiesterase